MNNLKYFRKMNKITQENLANVLGTTREQVSLYENGKRKLNEDQIRIICVHYQISADFLLGIGEYDNENN